MVFPLTRKETRSRGRPAYNKNDSASEIDTAVRYKKILGHFSQHLPQEYFLFSGWMQPIYITSVSLLSDSSNLIFARRFARNLYESRLRKLLKLSLVA